MNEHTHMAKKHKRNDVVFSSYVKYKVSSLSKPQINELRNKFVSELTQVRLVITRIQSGHFGTFNTFNNNNNNSKSKKKVSWSGLLKECGKVLTKLLKHEFAYVFNAPVDVVGMKLHDYYSIVKTPMDLGTVKLKLGKRVYSTPVEFAGDVRLTFSNALLYNPKTNEVNRMAEVMLGVFEELFGPIQERIEVLLGRDREVGVGGRRFNPLPSPRRVVKDVELRTSSVGKEMPVVCSVLRTLPVVPVKELRMSPVVNPVLPTLPVVKELSKGGRRSAVKLPKPRAKDDNKRGMSEDEKRKLGLALQSIPEEKMQQFVQIMRKKNERFGMDGDELEIDLDTIDTETLWELDRFVTNWKKYLSKNKGRSLSNPIMSTVPAPSTPIAETGMGVMSDTVKKPEDNEKENDDEDEDVDIEDDMPVTHFPTVEIEKDEEDGVGENQKDNGNGNASSSSSSSGRSGSDSSSSSDSDSGSSSRSGSEADEAQP